jgi:DNA polymerase II large subunit
LHIRSSFAVKFGKEVGFTLDRKQETLERDFQKSRKPRTEIRDDLVIDEITSIKTEKSDERFMYDLEVEETHNFLTSENMITNNCDGDEDAILMLMDGLLNFSRQFLPNMVGAKTMDAPLILSTVLNADEVDDEAWAMETVDEYPLGFYRETQEYRKPWELENEIEIGEDIVHSEEPFRHGYTHETSDIDDAPNQSEYVTLDEMSEKTSAQLGLGEKLKAVDEDAVAELLLEKHFIPDIKGNLRSFSSQKMRCVDCNEKFRRVPLTDQTIAPSGKETAQCPECGGKVLLTISEGTIKKYMQPSKDIIDSYEISPYKRQEIMILNRTIQSLFGKSNRQSGLTQFTG